VYTNDLVHLKGIAVAVASCRRDKIKEDLFIFGLLSTVKMAGEIALQRVEQIARSALLKRLRMVSLNTVSAPDSQSCLDLDWRSRNLNAYYARLGFRNVDSSWQPVDGVVRKAGIMIKDLI
jgi:hypothetical protein